MSDQLQPFEGWCVLELMGHRRLGGFVREQQIAGAAFLCIDVPGDEDGRTPATQFYSPGAVYAITPCTEAIARDIARSFRPEPVSRWDLRAIEAPRVQRAPYETGDPIFDEDDHPYIGSDDENTDAYAGAQREDLPFD